MIRVKAVYWMRRLTAPLMLELYLCALSISALVALVSVPHIVANILNAGAPPSELSYFIASVLHTAPAVQAILFVASIAFVFLIKDIAKNIHRSGALSSV